MKKGKEGIEMVEKDVMEKEVGCIYYIFMYIIYVKADIYGILKE